MNKTRTRRPNQKAMKLLIGYVEGQEEKQEQGGDYNGEVLAEVGNTLQNLSQRLKALANGEPVTDSQREAKKEMDRIFAEMLEGKTTTNKKTAKAS